MFRSNPLLFTEPECEARYRDLGLGEEFRGIQELARKGWVDRNIPNPENVAEHSVSAAIMVTHRFHDRIEELGLNIPIIQNILLIHDIHEPNTLGQDITPQDGIDPQEKKRRELEAVRITLQDNPSLLRLWMHYEEGGTEEGKIAKEIDKLQAIEKARFYENLHGKTGLTEEFYTYAVMKKGQIQTGFLLEYAESLRSNTQ